MNNQKTMPLSSAYSLRLHLPAAITDLKRVNYSSRSFLDKKDFTPGFLCPIKQAMKYG